MFRLFVVFVCILISSITEGQVFYSGSCPITPIFKNFNWDRYLGQWFEQLRYNAFFQKIGRCWSGTYIKDEYSGDLTVKFDFRDYVLNKPKSLTADVYAKNPYFAPNRLTYRLHGVPIYEGDFEVIATDYENWTVEYSCKDKPFGHVKYAWIMTRHPIPKKHVVNQAKRAMKEFGIDVHFLEKSDQSCKYIKVIEVANNYQ